MVGLKTKYGMTGCKRPVYRALAIGPATVVELCAEHYTAEQEDLGIKEPISHPA